MARVVLYAAFALTSIVVAVLWRDMTWSWLALGAFCSAQAVFSATTYKVQRDTAPNEAVLARAYRRLGQGYCVAGSLWLISAIGEHRVGLFPGTVCLIVGSAFWLLAQVDKTGSNPLASREYREIYAHLTAGERERLLEQAGRTGAEMAPVMIPVSMGIAVAVLSFSWSVRIGFAATAVLALYFALVPWPRLRDAAAHEGADVRYRVGSCTRVQCHDIEVLQVAVDTLTGIH